MKTADYKLIPMSEITDKARDIAVAWVENYTPHGSIMPEIAQKQKLASDIMNYAAQQNSELTKELTSLREKHESFAMLISKALDRLKCADDNLMQYNPNWSTDDNYKVILNLISTSYQCLMELESKLKKDI